METTTETLRCRRCDTEFSHYHGSRTPYIFEPDPKEVIAYCSWECADA